MKTERKRNPAEISKLKICILGSYKGAKDEGMANVAYYLYENLIDLFPAIVLLDISEIWKWKFWKEMNRLHPDILHYVPGPTLKGLMVAKVLQMATRSRLVVSATKPVLPSFFGKISRFIRPDIVIVQSSKSEIVFKKAGYRTTFIPNGVNTDKFVPVSALKKSELRRKYGIEDKEFIVLHIGPLKKGRNQRALLALKDQKILLVTSISNPSEKDLFDDVSTHRNVIVWNKYFENIQEIYAIADVYIFPVFEELNSIEIPLSVLEAMSCNLPVISTHYGGLNKILQEGSGFFYMEDEQQLFAICEEIRSGKIIVNTRKKVEPYSWKSISRMISNTFLSLYGWET